MRRILEYIQANRLRVVLVLAALISPAYSDPIRLRTGSLNYAEPFQHLTRDNQEIRLTGNRGFTFTGRADVVQLDVVDCPYAGCSTAEKQSVNFYIGGQYGNGTTRGVGLIGTAMLDGMTYSNVGAPNAYERLSIYAYGKVRIPAVRQRMTKTVSVLLPLVGSFTHARVPMMPVTETISGRVLATVELEQYQGKWAVESISYDVVRQ